MSTIRKPRRLTIRERLAAGAGALAVCGPVAAMWVALANTSTGRRLVIESIIAAGG